MKITILILSLLYFLTGCDDHNLTHQETVTTYYNARDTSNYDELKTVINDSLTIISGDYVMPYNQDGFYEQFKWDSIFKTSYNIVELVEKDNQIMASVTMNSIRNEFLKNSDMTCQYKISFIAGRISKIEELDCKNADWNIWGKERDSLVNWIDKNHPKLNGFINDMTMNGAQNYLKAIELYKAKK